MTSAACTTRSATTALAAVLCLALCVCAPRPVTAAPPPESFADVVRTVKPAVVNIFSTRLVRGPGSTGDPAEDFFRHFFGEGPPRVQRQQSLGSGFIIDRDGHIVTNAHVVQQAEQIRVKLSNREEYDAEVVGTDPKTDVAVIKIKPRKELPVARLADSDTLEVGDWVIAIGNPFGLAETVTAGIVSAKGRVIGAGPYDDFIQTDASINPGNSGGPLVNARGEVVGINTAIFSRSGGSVGIGFAIPINHARRIAEDLRGGGRVVRGWLGLSVQEVTPELAETFGLGEPRGALIVDVEAGGPAARAGLQRGDVLLTYNGVAITNSHQIPALVAETAVGNVAELTVLRDRSERRMTITVAEQPSAKTARPQVREPSADWGIQVTDLTASLARRLGVPRDTRAVVVSEVAPGSPAEEAGLEPGDLLRQVDRKEVRSAKECDQALRRAGNTVLLLVQRGPALGFITLSR